MLLLKRKIRTRKPYQSSKEIELIESQALKRGEVSLVTKISTIVFLTYVPLISVQAVCAHQFAWLLMFSISNLWNIFLKKKVYKAQTSLNFGRKTAKLFKATCSYFLVELHDASQSPFQEPFQAILPKFFSSPRCDRRTQAGSLHCCCNASILWSP